MGSYLRIIWPLLIFGVVWFLGGPNGSVGWPEVNLERVTQSLVWGGVALIGLFALAFAWAVISLRHRNKYESGYPRDEANEEAPSK